MTDALTGLSRYLLAIFIIFYTFHCFIVFAFKSGRERTVFYVFQYVLLAFTHILGFYVLSVRQENPDLMFICALQEVMLFAVIALYRVIYPKASRLVTNNMCFLLAIGFIMLTRLSYNKSVKQFIIVAFCLAVTLVIPFLLGKLEPVLKKYTMYYGIGGILILLFMMTKGSVTNGSKITLTIAGFTFAPSEFVKILYVFFIAGMLTPEEGETGILKDKPRIISAALISMLHIIVLVLCKDLGGALIFFVVGLFMFYAALRMPAVLIGGILSGACASVIGYKLFSHVRVRVAAWRDPFEDIEGPGYQLAQSLFAIGTGSWAGMGLGLGSPDKIPVVVQDFIFSAISEEMGALFALCLILICLSNFLMFMNISMSLKDMYFKLISLGLAVNYGFQIFLTIGGVTRFIPLTGVTLPLISYGGTSVVSTLIMFAVIQGLYVID